MVAINEKSLAGSPQNLPVGNYYLLQDTLYRAAALTNSSGNVVEAYDCDAYGNTIIFTAADSSGNWWGDSATQSSLGANSIIYCGYRYDPETENYYVRNRFYAPALGRWLTRDPIGYQGGINLYEYVGGAPAGNVDASGLAGGWVPTPWGALYSPGAPPPYRNRPCDRRREFTVDYISGFAWIPTAKPLEFAPVALRSYAAALAGTDGVAAWAVVF